MGASMRFIAHILPFINNQVNVTGICIRYLASGIRHPHLLLDLRFFFAYDKSGGTGRNFVAEVLKGMSAPK
jgi:hypothetical protein